MKTISVESQLFWWEKTIEYSFVRNIIPKLSSAFPLDGDLETAFGDLLLKEGTNIRIIEFKSTKEQIQTEKKKWGFTKEKCPNYYLQPFEETLQACWSETVKNLPARKAHWLIYGEPTESGFSLTAKDYWHESQETYSLEKSEHLEKLNTAKTEDMLNYLKIFRNRKKRHRRRRWQPCYRGSCWRKHVNFNH